MHAIDSHPGADELSAFTLGRLDGDPLAFVEAHLAACPACQARAAVAPNDSLVGLLQTAHARAARQGDTAADAATGVTLAFTGQGAETPPAAESPSGLGHHERYRLVRLLGEGGMGAVYEAEHRVMQRPVALKVISPRFVSNAAAVDRFRREARAAARLSHPNIVHAYDAENAGETHFLVTEYIAGTTLGRLVKEGGPLPAALACEYARQAALGLQHAHERGMVHRDVKPDNLILTEGGVVKVLDFGLASLTAERGEDGLTDQNVVMGTPEYMAPEQAEDSRSADTRADVYSLGCTLFYLLTGKAPYPASTSMLKILGHRERPVPAIPGLPDGLMALLRRLMAKRPEDRYQTPGEAAAALAPFTRPTEERPRAGVWGLAAVALLAAAALAGVVVHRIQTDNGELSITTEDDDIEVVVKQGGKLVRIIDTKSEKVIVLRSGVYELEVKGGEGLKLDIDKATLKRGDRVVARIERVKKGKPDEAGLAKAAELPAKAGLIRGVPVETTRGHIRVPLSPDGRLAAFEVGRGGWQVNKLRVEETGSGKLVGWVGTGDENITAAVFTADGKRMAYTTQAALVMWDIQAGSGRKLPLPAGWPSHLSLSDDGTRLGMLVNVDRGWACRVVETATGRLLAEASHPPGKGDGVGYALIAGDGRRACFILNSHQDLVPGGTFEVIIDDMDGKGAKARFKGEGFAAYPFEDRANGRIGLTHYTPAGRGILYLDAGTLKEAGRVAPEGAEKSDTLIGLMGGKRAALHRPKETRLYDLPPGKPLSSVEPQGLYSADGRVSWTTRDGRIWLYRHPDPMKP